MFRDLDGWRRVGVTVLLPENTQFLVEGELLPGVAEGDDGLCLQLLCSCGLWAEEFYFKGAVLVVVNECDFF